LVAGNKNPRHNVALLLGHQIADQPEAERDKCGIEFFPRLLLQFAQLPEIRSPKPGALSVKEDFGIMGSGAASCRFGELTAHFPLHCHPLSILLSQFAFNGGDVPIVAESEAE
jgi:hypothetical protein